MIPRIISLIGIFVCFLAISLLWTNQWWVFWLLLGVALSLWAIEGFDVCSVILFVSVGVTGYIGALLAVYSGALSYGNSFVFGVPAWVPFIFGVIALYTRALIDVFEKKKFKGVSTSL